jgi:hypothetical protein
MRNESRKYYIENMGAFAVLDDKEFNELCGYELSLLHVPAVLYVKDGYRYAGNELLLSHRDLKAVIETTIKYSIN